MSVMQWSNCSRIGYMKKCRMGSCMFISDEMVNLGISDIPCPGYNENR